MSETGKADAAMDSGVFEIEAHYLVMFQHPAMEDGSWRVWGRAATGEEATRRLREAQEERPTYTFRLAIKQTTKEWA